MEAEHGWIACPRPAPLAHSWVTHPFCSMLAWRLPGPVGGRLALASLFLLIWPRPVLRPLYPANFQFPFSSFQFLISSSPLPTSNTCHAITYKFGLFRPEFPRLRLLTSDKISRFREHRPPRPCWGHRPRFRSLLPYLATSSPIITLPFPQRPVAFPLHRTAHPLWDAPPSRTIEGRSEAKPAFHARPLVEGSLSRTSWVR